MAGALRSSESSRTRITLSTSHNQWRFKTDKNTDSSAVGNLRAFVERMAFRLDLEKVELGHMKTGATGEATA